MKVLMAETDPVVAAAIQSVLEEDGCEVAVAANSLDAWDRIGANPPPDLLITCIVFGSGQVPGTALGCRAHSMRIPVIYTPANVEGAVHADAEYGVILIQPLDLRDLARTARSLLVRNE